MQSIEPQETEVRNAKKRVHIGGAPIDPMEAREAALWALKRIKSGARVTVAPVNAAIVVEASREPAFRQALEGFDLTLADGAWPALAATWLFRLHVPHANTSDFVRAVLSESSADGLRIFLLGGHPNVVKRAEANLPRFHPKAKIVGSKDGYFESREEANILDVINKSGANILLLGISSPKKEFFIQRHWAQLSVSMSVGVGGLFDIWAGETREAPDWVRKYGFEWFFRLIQEPGRLWKRYTIENLRFIFIVLKQALGVLLTRGRRDGLGALASRVDGEQKINYGGIFSDLKSQKGEKNAGEHLDHGRIGNHR